MNHSLRKTIMFSFTSIVVVLLMASAAFACTIYKGKMEVTDSAGNVSYAHGAFRSMAHCGGAPTSSAASLTSTGPAATFSVAVSPTTYCEELNKPNKLDADEYFITYYPRDNANSLGADCMDVTAGGQGTRVTTQTMTVDSNGNGMLSNITPTVPMLGPSIVSVCVTSRTGGGDGVPDGMLVNVGLRTI